MPSPLTIVVFTIDARRFAVPLPSVERIIRLIDYRPLPHAPEIVLGVINFQGAVLPVIDLRRRFRLPEREPRLDDHLILARTPRRRVALLADEVNGLESVADDTWVSAQNILPRAEYLAGAVKRDDGLILVHDLDACLSLDEERALTASLAASPPP